MQEIKLNINLAPYYNPMEDKVEWVNPVIFLNPKRIDVFLKYKYAKAILNGVNEQYYEDIYCAMVRCGSYFVEPDKKDKVGKKVFIENFKKLVFSIRDNGFKENEVVPYDVNGLIMDGAHRTAVAIALGIKIPAIKLEGICNPIYNIQTLRDKHMDTCSLDRLVVDYVKENNDYRCVMLNDAEYQLFKDSDDLLDCKSVKIDGAICKLCVLKSKEEESTTARDLELLEKYYDGRKNQLSLVEFLHYTFSKKTIFSYLRMLYYRLRYVYFKTRLTLNKL